MASFYGTESPNGPNDGDVWVNSTTGEAKVWQGSAWRSRAGFGAGSGAAVTQITNRSTGVEINAICGEITTDATSLAAGAEATFVVTNSLVAIGDVVVICARSGQTAGTSIPFVTAVANGSFSITLSNHHASTADTGAMIINFAIIKASGS